MADATRYFTIPQSTFQTYFTLSPGGDPCTVSSYAIYSSISPLTVWPVADSQILLTGTFGSYQLKMDKTVATNTKTFYL